LALRFVMAAGGTGGHIFPAIAVARELERRAPNCQILFLGTRRGLESEIVPREGFQLELIEVGALKGLPPIERLKSLARLPLSFFAARRILARFGPDLAMGTGGYVSGPVLLAAWSLRVPTLILEPNAVPGLTNRLLARLASAVAVCFEESLGYFRGRGILTGNPIRREFAQLKRKPRGDTLSVLIFGGSQGAHAINLAMSKALPLLAPKRDRLLIVHQTGQRDLQMVKRAYEEAGFESAEVVPFIIDMPAYFERADLLICRAGAITLAEVAAAGKAAILIPFPFATDDHQRKNAEAFQRAGAARVILQQELTPERLAREIAHLLEHPEEISRMEEAARGLSRADASSQVAELALKLAKKR
jgi:UDP-N-acetylglucosamine--N-acetylmuramyl-(pentapeptide) pyrophosphoryl-undecaprenol N-acetylglucosamine transferase